MKALIFILALGFCLPATISAQRPDPGSFVASNGLPLGTYIFTQEHHRIMTGKSTFTADQKYALELLESYKTRLHIHEKNGTVYMDMYLDLQDAQSPITTYTLKPTGEDTFVANDGHGGQVKGEFNPEYGSYIMLRAFTTDEHDNLHDALFHDPSPRPEQPTR